jgi:hypothetical protein
MGDCGGDDGDDGEMDLDNGRTLRVFYTHISTGLHCAIASLLDAMLAMVAQLCWCLHNSDAPRASLRIRPAGGQILRPSLCAASLLPQFFALSDEKKRVVRVPPQATAVLAHLGEPSGSRSGKLSPTLALGDHFDSSLWGLVLRYTHR